MKLKTATVLTSIALAFTTPAIRAEGLSPRLALHAARFGELRRPTNSVRTRIRLQGVVTTAAARTRRLAHVADERSAVRPVRRTDKGGVRRLDRTRDRWARHAHGRVPAGGIRRVPPRGCRLRSRLLLLGRRSSGLPGEELMSIKKQTPLCSVEKLPNLLRLNKRIPGRVAGCPSTEMAQ